MNKLLSTLPLLAIVVGFVAPLSNAVAGNAAGGANSPACVACADKVKKDAGCTAKDASDPAWNQACTDAVAKIMTTCKTECKY